MGIRRNERRPPPRQMAAHSKLVADDLPVELLTEIARHCTHSSAVAALSCCSHSARAGVEQAAKYIVRPILCATPAYRRPAHDAVTYSQLWLVHLVHNEPDWRANCLIGNFGRSHAIRLLERGADASLVVAAYRCDRETTPRSTMGAPHHGCTPPHRLPSFPALHAAHPLSQWANADRSHATVPAHTHLSCAPPCVRRLSLLDR